VQFFIAGSAAYKPTAINETAIQQMIIFIFTPIGSDVMDNNINIF
jgi:hypothetical protein